MSASLTLLPLELRTQIISCIVSDDLSASLRRGKKAALLHTNHQLREEYLDVVASDKNLAFYIFYPETAMWVTVIDKPARLKIFLRSSFVDLFYLNSLASAQRLCENIARARTGGNEGILAVRDQVSQMQRFWQWIAD